MLAVKNHDFGYESSPIMKRKYRNSLWMIRSHSEPVCNCALMTHSAMFYQMNQNFYPVKLLSKEREIKKTAQQNEENSAQTAFLQFPKIFLCQNSTKKRQNTLCCVLTTWWGLNLIEKKSSRIAESGFECLSVCSFIVHCQ